MNLSLWIHSCSSSNLSARDSFESGWRMFGKEVYGV